jgi:hypothetical protein
MLPYFASTFINLEVDKDQVVLVHNILYCEKEAREHWNQGDNGAEDKTVQKDDE